MGGVSGASRGTGSARGGRTSSPLTTYCLDGYDCGEPGQLYVDPWTRGPVDLWTRGPGPVGP
eukprot:5874868-Lingulodinium_polyedra.AAC.1